METADYLAALRREGDLLAAAAGGADPDTPIPTCSEWRMRDLVHHIGGVHRWATAHITGRSGRPIDDMDEVVPRLPDDEALVDWFREGHADLLGALESADPRGTYWTFFATPEPVTFWARRQLHETGIHRADAESAKGGVTPFAPDLAVDGINEMLTVFVVRPNGRLRTDPPLTLHLHATDIDGEWLVIVGPHGVEARSGHAKADCAVRAPASDLLLLLWNRRPHQALEVHGDPAVLDLWRERMQVRWSRGRGGGRGRADPL